MTLYQYSDLNKNQKADRLWEEGEFISNTKVGADIFVLYAFYGYFVEVLIVEDRIF